MQKKDDVLETFQHLLLLKIIMVRKDKKWVVQTSTGSDEPLFHLSPEKVLLFRYKLEDCLGKKLNSISKLISWKRDKERKNVIKLLLAFINKMKPNPSLSIEMFDQLKNIKKTNPEIFSLFVANITKDTIEDEKEHWEELSKETFQKLLSGFREQLEMHLAKLEFPKKPSKPETSKKNLFNLRHGNESEEKVRKLYDAMKNDERIQGGDREAFVAFWKGGQINRNIKFDLIFDEPSDACDFLRGLADDQRIILFPISKRFPAGSKRREVPWKYLDLHFTILGKPISTIMRYKRKKVMPDYLKKFIDILRRGNSLKQSTN